MNKISIIIPTCNRIDLLSICLNTLQSGNQTFSSNFYEVIVTDDSSNEETKNFVTSNYPWVQFCVGPRKGPAANRNNGAKYANYNWLVFFDDDCIPDSNILEAYNKAIDTYPNICVFEGKIYANRAKERLDEESPTNLTGGYLWSCNFAIKKELFVALNGFDEDYVFAAMEDVDLHYRIKERGEKVHFLSAAAVCHPWRIVKGWNLYKRKRLALLLYLAKHSEEKNRINKKYYLHGLYAYLFLQFPKEAIRFKFKGFRNSVYYSFYLLSMIFKV